jgi:hypothetical protein
MLRACAVFLLVLLLLPATAAAQDPRTLAEGSTQTAQQTALRLEQRLLALDLVSYREARERDQRARQAVDQVLARVDEALAGDAVTLGTLEDLRNDLDAARAVARITEQRLGGELEKIQERLRRIGLLEGDTGAPARAADAISGRWRVTVMPQNATATFELRLNGTVVTGSYQVAGGSPGSFRGTYTNGRLRLERIDARGGFDSVWEGTAAGGRLAGTWMSNELVTGQPTRGEWTAVREGGQQP